MIYIYNISFFDLENYKQKGALLIDIRPYKDFLSYHIPHSHSIHDFSFLPRGQPIIFICEHGKLAQEYALYYRNYFYDCYYLEGGIQFYLEMNKSQIYY